VLLDTGPIIGLLSKADDHHASTVAALRASVQKGRRLVTAWEAVGEAYTVIRLRASPAGSAAAAVRVLEWATESGVDLALTSQKDHLRAAAILRGHSALRLSYVDALLLALAEALEVEEIMTTDGRHFATVKLRGRPTVTLV